MTDEKNRIVLIKKDDMTVRFSYNYLSDEAFEAALIKLAKQFDVEVSSILTFTLGDRDQTEEGVFFFCPKCGEYNEYGYEPDVRQYYRKDPETKEMVPAGYFKEAAIDCSSCNEVYTLTCEKFQEEMEILNKEMTK